MRKEGIEQLLASNMLSILPHRLVWHTRNVDGIEREREVVNLEESKLYERFEILMA